MKRRTLTEFEKAVYQAVMEIPLGQTRSYAWVARRIGRPRATRAVGTALRKNPFAPWVPCHRVVASSGALGGYSGGLKKKIRLLKQECDFLTADRMMSQGQKVTTSQV